MLNNYTKETKEVVTLYRILKELILYNEEINLKIDIQAAMELSRAFDHFMRALSSDFGIDKVKSEQYIELQLKKVRDHTTRAGYDTLDWLGIKLRELIAVEMNKFSLETIKEVWPEYYKTERTKIVTVTQNIANARFKKDSVDSDDNFNNFILYSKQIKELMEIHKQALLKCGCMIDYEKKLKKQKRRDTWLQILYIVLGGIGGFLLGLITEIIKCKNN